jgi:hypothetical protein
MSEEEKGLPAAEEETQPDKNEDKPSKPEPEAGFQIQLEVDGQITRRVYGTKQNMATMFGLVEVMRSEVSAMASRMPGQTPTREVSVLSQLATGITNIANVLVGMQAAVNQLTQRVEELANDKSEPELKDSSGETVPTEGPGE